MLELSFKNKSIFIIIQKLLRGKQQLTECSVFLDSTNAYYINNTKG